VEYEVLGGSNTSLALATVNVADPVTRLADVYVDDLWGGVVYWGSIYSPGYYEFNIGTYYADQRLIVRLVFRNMPDISYAKKVTQLAVHSCLWTLEIDYMSAVNHDSVNSWINTMNAYHILYSYKRVYWYWSGNPGDTYQTTTADHRYYWLTCFEHKTYSFWE